MHVHFAKGALAGLGLWAALGAGPAQAQADPDQVVRLFDALELPGIIAVMQREGLDYADQIATDLIPGDPSASWNATIAGIYDIERMEQMALSGMIETLDGAAIEAMLAFYDADPGRTIPQLEVSAREAMLMTEIEDAAKEIAAGAIAEETDRYLLVRDFVEANDLIELNVMGALNANYAFFSGLQAGGALPPGMTDDQILADVWSQEPDIRTNTTEWVYAFLMLAYQPLSAAELETFTAFSQTPAGQQMNRALFEAFDRMFLDISRALGEAAADELTTQEL